MRNQFFGMLTITISYTNFIKMPTLLYIAPMIVGVFLKKEIDYYKLFMLIFS